MPHLEERCIHVKGWSKQQILQKVIEIFNNTEMISKVEIDPFVIRYKFWNPDVPKTFNPSWKMVEKNE